MTTTLRPLISDCQHISLLAGAHDVISGRLAQDAGFDAIWASSLEISAAWGRIDNDDITMTEVLNATKAMARALTIPVLADVGTGWGDDGDVARVVAAFEEAGAGGVCIEDSAYPRRNSLLPGARPLTPSSEFADRIATACAARCDKSFSIVARVESLIAKQGVSDALARGALYAAAGADAVVIHSKSPCCDEVLAVAREWAEPVSLILIPTAYPSLTVDEVRRLGAICALIYANQGLRAATHATTMAFRQILQDGNGAGVQRWIAPIGELLGERTEAELANEELAMEIPQNKTGG